MNADEDAKKLAIRIAPKSPAALAYLKQHPELAPDTNNVNQTTTKDKKEPEEGSGMTTVQANVADDVVAAAFDDPNPQSIIIGQGKLALNADYYSDEDTFESNTYVAMRNKSFTSSPPSMAPLQGTPAIRSGKRSQFNVDNLSYRTESPH